MKIHASPNLTSDAVLLDVDRKAGELVVATVDGPDPVNLTRDEAAELRAELDRAIGELDRKAGRSTRTAEDVLNNPEPGDRVEWEDGEVWTVTGRDTQILHEVTPPYGGRVYSDWMGLDIWADPMDDGDGSPFVCVPHP